MAYAWFFFRCCRADVNALSKGKNIAAPSLKNFYKQKSQFSRLSILLIEQLIKHNAHTSHYIVNGIYLNISPHHTQSKKSNLNLKKLTYYINISLLINWFIRVFKNLINFSMHDNEQPNSTWGMQYFNLYPSRKWKPIQNVFLYENDMDSVH